MVKINFDNSNAKKVKDENEKEIIYFEESKALPTRIRYSIINTDHKKIGYIEKIRNNFGLFDLPQIVISMNDADKIVLKKDIKELKDIYDITGNGISIIGNWGGPSFNIFQKETMLASVEVKKEEIGRTYLVDIIDKSNEEQVICILFALNWIM